MKNNKERILCNLEYIEGGITALKTLCNVTNNSTSESYYKLFSEWQDILCETLDIIEEDNEDAEDY